MKTDPRVMYQNALDRLAVKGNRYAAIGSVVYWGCACHLSVEEIIADVRARGVLDRDADVRRNYPSAKKKVEAFEASRNHRSWTTCSTFSAARRPHELKKRIEAVCFVQRQIKIGRTETSKILGVCAAALPACALMKFVVEVVCGMERHKPKNQTTIFLQTLCGADRSAWVEIRKDKKHRQPYKRKGIRQAGEWIDVANANVDDGELGELVSINPLTGNELPNASGRGSLIVRGCVASFRHMLLEFDSLDLKEQLFFWIGVLLTGELNVLTLTFSGKKSIHAIVEVEANTLEEWNAVRDEIKRRFATEADERYRLDVQSLTPEAGTRLAGVVRSDTGLVQELLFVRGLVPVVG